MDERGAEIIEILFKLQRERGSTLILVTHDEALAKRCDRIVRLRDGKIESIEDAIQLAPEPVVVFAPLVMLPESEPAAALAPVALLPEPHKIPEPDQEPETTVPNRAQAEQASDPDQSDLTEKAEPATGDTPPQVPQGETVVTEVPGQPVAPAVAAVAAVAE